MAERLDVTTGTGTGTGTGGGTGLTHEPVVAKSQFDALARELQRVRTAHDEATQELAAELADERRCYQNTLAVLEQRNRELVRYHALHVLAAEVARAWRAWRGHPGDINAAMQALLDHLDALDQPQPAPAMETHNVLCGVVTDDVGCDELEGCPEPQPITEHATDGEHDCFLMMCPGYDAKAGGR